jgi:hypothetical protein
MRRVALVFAVLIIALAAASQATAKQSAMAKAVYAVKEEIGNEWTLLTTVPKSLKVPGARASVSCKELSATRFRCSFTATNSIGYQAYGDARVKVFPHGAEATLLRAKCYVEAEGEILPGLTCR